MADLKEINLKIKGSNRPATAWFDEQQRQYNAFVPAAKVVDGSGMGYENPSVQAHMSTFDENGDLVGVDAYGYGAEGGFYPTPWPTKQDSIYNANAAKQYAPQVFNQVKKKQIGGLMNYSQYLQQGGGIENQIAQLVQAALSGDQQANSQIEQIMQAAQKGDKQAQQIAQMIQQIAQQLQGEQGESAQTEAMKCGGKMRAKVKKAACGKKMEVGAEIKKSKKVCACQLKKVGGKLIEVDGCTGLPIHRNGGSVNKFQPGGELTFWQKYSQTKPINIQQFARTYLSDQAIGNAIKRGWNAADKYLNENVFTGSFWQNGPSKPVQQVTPNERASMNGAGNQPLTQKEVNQAIAQSREGVKKIQPTTIQIDNSSVNESTVTPEPKTETKKEVPVVDNQLALKNWYNRYTPEQQRNIQLALQRAGYDIGKYGADGKIGNDTIRAIRKFQQDNKLLLDGKAGENTLRKLWDIAYTGKSYATDAVIPSAVNLNSIRKDIYNPATTSTPYAQINPMIAANKQGGSLTYAQFLGL